MTYQIDRSIEIEAPAHVVWATVQNPTLRALWDARVRSARALDRAPLRAGSRIEVVLGLGGLPVRSVLRYLTWAPPFRSAVCTINRDQFGSMTAGSWTFREDGAGRTTWTTRLSFRATAPIVGPLVERWFGRWFERLTVESQRNLKAFIEGRRSVAVS